MANDETQEHEGGLYASAAATDPHRRERRRKQAAVAVAGAAALLAGVAFLGTQLIDAEQPSVPEPAALAPLTASATATSSLVPGAEPSIARTSRPPKPAQPVQLSPTPTASRTSPLAPTPTPPAPADPSELAARLNGPVNERTEALENGTIRIVSAARDLSGEREMLLAGDDGAPVGGGVRCTTDVRMPAVVPDEQRPTMLLCWRTSQARSVVTMAVVANGDAPTDKSVDIIGKEWAKLG